MGVLSFWSYVMTNTTSRATANADKLRDKRVQQEIIAISDDIRSQRPWLKYQDTIGLSIFSISIFGCLLNAYLYIQGVMPAWMVILGTAFWTSILARTRA